MYFYVIVSGLTSASVMWFDCFGGSIIYMNIVNGLSGVSIRSRRGDVHIDWGSEPENFRLPPVLNLQLWAVYIFAKYLRYPIRGEANILWSNVWEINREKERERERGKRERMADNISQISIVILTTRWISRTIYSQPYITTELPGQFRRI